MFCPYGGGFRGGRKGRRAGRRWPWKESRDVERASADPYTSALEKGGRLLPAGRQSGRRVGRGPMLAKASVLVERAMPRRAPSTLLNGGGLLGGLHDVRRALSPTKPWKASVLVDRGKASLTASALEYGAGLVGGRQGVGRFSWRWSE